MAHRTARPSNPGRGPSSTHEKGGLIKPPTCPINRDRYTLDVTDLRPFDQKMYAVSLLAKLLDRARLLNIALRSAEYGNLNQADIQSAIWIFTGDCAEVRMRAYQAGLLDEPHDAHLAWSWMESDDVGMGVLHKPPRLPIAADFQPPGYTAKNSCVTASR